VSCPSTFALAGWLFRRLLGLVCLAAFASLAPHIVGLVGHDGILPVDRYMADVRAILGGGSTALDLSSLCPTVSRCGRRKVADFYCGRPAPSVEARRS
jgi:hypothetical protein